MLLIPCKQASQHQRVTCNQTHLGSNFFPEQVFIFLSGLPHSHILLIVWQEDRPRTAEDVDSVISAELPDPTQSAQARQLHEVVTGTMVHRQCGAAHRTAACMDGQRPLQQGLPEAVRVRDGVAGRPPVPRVPSATGGRGRPRGGARRSAHHQPVGGAVLPVPVPALRGAHQRGGLLLCAERQVPFPLHLQGTRPPDGARGQPDRRRRRDRRLPRSALDRRQRGLLAAL